MAPPDLALEGPGIPAESAHPGLVAALPYTVGRCLAGWLLSPAGDLLALNRLRCRRRTSAQRCLHPRELVLDVGGGGELFQLKSDVVLGRPCGIVQSTTGQQLIDGTGTGLHLGRFVLGPLDRKADIAHLLTDAGEGFVDPGLCFSRGVGGLDRLLPGTEGVHLGLQTLAGAGELLLFSLQLSVLRLEIAQLLLNTGAPRQCFASEVLPADLERLWA